MTTVRVSPPSGKIEPGSGLYSFRCAGCSERHHIGVYAVAQCAMGHDMTHTCPCGQRHVVASRGRSYSVRALGKPQ